MTTFTQLRDILDRLKTVHERAAECCAQAKHSDDERLNLLVEYFHRWERRLEDWLDSLERERRKTFLDTWVQFAPIEDVDHALATLCEAQEKDTETVANACFDLRQEVLKLIGLMADRLKGPDVREHLLKLAEIERKAARELAIADVMRRDA